jgi:hypothetical protein
MKRWLVMGLVAASCGALSIKVASTAASHDDAFTTEGVLTAKAADLKTTSVSPTLDAPIQPGRNVVWCGTFQLVWNRMCNVLGEDVHFVGEPPWVAEMNKKVFTEADLDADSYVALAGLVRDGIRAKIRKALEDKFKGQASPHFLPDPAAAPRPQDIVGYAYLFKHLEFATPFEQLDEPLVFEGKKVAAFGMDPNKPGHATMCRQVSILDYTSPDDFIIELVTKSQGDRLLLAKVSLKATLGETVDAVRGRIAEAKSTLAGSGDMLSIPKANFEITRTFNEIMGKNLNYNPFPDVASGGLEVFLPGVPQVTEAGQTIRFQLDEKGVRLQSESKMSFGCGAARTPPPKHTMIFNKPFLLMMQRAKASKPYFALWVGDGELLVPSEE